MVRGIAVAHGPSSSLASASVRWAARMAPGPSPAFSRSTLSHWLAESAVCRSWLTASRSSRLELETLETDGNGNFRVAPGDADNIAGSQPGDNNRASEPEDRRQVVFINSRRLFPAKQ